MKTCVPTKFTKLSAKYADSFPLRSLIQGLPMVGGPIDTLFSGLGAKWQYERLEHFISLLNERMTALEILHNNIELQPSEDLYDFLFFVFDNVIKTKALDKLSLFANIVVNQFVMKLDWSEADAAIRFLAHLSPIHISILKNSITDSGSACAVFIPQFIKLSDSDRDRHDLRAIFPDISEIKLRIAVSDLISLGLLRDDHGIGTVPGERFISTSLAKWLLQWTQTN